MSGRRARHFSKSFRFDLLFLVSSFHPKSRKIFKYAFLFYNERKEGGRIRYVFPSSKERMPQVRLCRLVPSSQIDTQEKRSPTLVFHWKVAFKGNKKRKTVSFETGASSTLFLHEREEALSRLVCVYHAS